jgi:hypothetical protein
VEHIEPYQTLRLRAEMKLPGKAWLQFDVHPLTGNQSLLIQTAMFAPRGLLGVLYWYVLYPVHARVFAGLINGLAAEAIKVSRVPAST